MITRRIHDYTAIKDASERHNSLNREIDNIYYWIKKQGGISTKGNTIIGGDTIITAEPAPSFPLSNNTYNLHISTVMDLANNPQYITTAYGEVILPLKTVIDFKEPARDNINKVTVSARFIPTGTDKEASNIGKEPIAAYTDEMVLESQSGYAGTNGYTYPGTLEYCLWYGGGDTLLRLQIVEKRTRLDNNKQLTITEDTIWIKQYKGQIQLGGLIGLYYRLLIGGIFDIMINVNGK